MRKPTLSSKKWNAIHVRNLRYRENRHNSVKNTSGQMLGSGSGRSKMGPVHITCPPDFSLETNFNDVMDVLSKIRKQSERQRNERVHIDFREIKILSPSAALVLAAELDRWNKLSWKQGKLRSAYVSEWDSQVRQLLDDMGFFELLEAEKSFPPYGNSDMKYVKFRTGSKADGEAIERMQTDDLMHIVGEMPGKRYLYAAVTEAMINVVQHAYSGIKMSSWLAPKCWWLSASYSHTKREVTIMIYDQGEGIPATLPRTVREKFRKIPAYMKLGTDHAGMIEAAHRLKRSASGHRHRGFGLQRDVRGYLEKLDCHGYYRVVSLKGEYVFEKNPRGNGIPRKKTHSRPLRGTLIEWRLSLK